MDQSSPASALQQPASQSSSRAGGPRRTSSNVSSALDQLQRTANNYSGSGSPSSAAPSAASPRPVTGSPTSPATVGTSPQSASRQPSTAASVTTQPTPQTTDRRDHSPYASSSALSAADNDNTEGSTTPYGAGRRPTGAPGASAGNNPVKRLVDQYKAESPSTPSGVNVSAISEASSVGATSATRRPLLQEAYRQPMRGANPAPGLAYEDSALQRVAQTARTPSQAQYSRSASGVGGARNDPNSGRTTPNNSTMNISAASTAAPTAGGELPGATKPMSGAAYRRMQAWNAMRDETMQVLREEKRKLDEGPNTFQPHVDHYPRATAADRSYSRSRSKMSNNSSDGVATPTAVVDNSMMVGSKSGSPRSLSEAAVDAHSLKTMGFVERSAAQQNRHDATIESMRKHQAVDMTFQPEVHYHPVHDSQPSVIGRPTEAQIRRESFDEQERLSRIEREELSQCTFQPRIGPQSRHVYSTSRIEEGQMDVYTRLYSRSTAAKESSSEWGASGAAAEGSPNASVLPEELCPRLPSALSEELDGLRSLCGTHAGHDDVWGTFMRNVLAVQLPTHPLPPPVELEEGDDEPFCHYTADAKANQQRRRKELGFSSATKKKNPNTSGTVTGNSAGNSTSVAMNFDEFLQRQQDKEHKRRERLQELTQETAAPHKPMILKQSRMLAENREQYLAEAAEHGDSGERSTFRRQTYQDPTFKPMISSVARHFPKRGTDRMHRDYGKYEAHKKELRERKDEADMADVTFSPATNTEKAQYRHIESTLKPKNMKAYNDALQRSRNAAEQKRQQQQEKEEHELHLKCTFRPLINRSPSYVAAMAGSYSIMRDAQDSLQAETGVGVSVQQRQQPVPFTF